ncbi:PRC-barrel domain-containing protein, partial [Streptomyces tricolor]
MNTLELASGLSGRVVVTLGGEAVAQVKDVVFDGPAGRITGFTLSGRGLLAGPMKRSLPFSGVHAIGPSAVMIAGETVFEDRDAVVGRGEAEHGKVLGAGVVTQHGTGIGTVAGRGVEWGGRGGGVG